MVSLLTFGWDDYCDFIDLHKPGVDTESSKITNLVSPGIHG